MKWAFWYIPPDRPVRIGNISTQNCLASDFMGSLKYLIMEFKHIEVACQYVMIINYTGPGTIYNTNYKTFS